MNTEENIWIILSKKDYFIILKQICCFTTCLKIPFEIDVIILIKLTQTLLSFMHLKHFWYPIDDSTISLWHVEK